MHASISQVLVTTHTNLLQTYNKIIYNGRFTKQLIALLNEADGAVRPWTQSAFEMGVTVQCD